MNRELNNINADDDEHVALKSHQDKFLKGNDTCKDSLSFPMMSTVTIHQEEGGPCMCRVIEEASSTNYSG